MTGLALSSPAVGRGVDFWATGGKDLTPLLMGMIGTSMDDFIW